MRSCAQFLSWFLLLVPFGALAVFVDEAFEVDYHHALLGTPRQQSTIFHRPSAISKASLLYTISEKGVLGAVNPKDGSIVWRQRLVDTARNHTFKSILGSGEGENTIYSGTNGDVQAWDAADGKQVWNYAGKGEIVDLQVLPSDNGQKNIIILTDHEGSAGTVKKIAANSGKVIWDFQDNSGGTSIGLSTFEGNLWHISLHSTGLKGSRIKVTSLDILTGKQVGVIEPNSDDIISLKSILFVGKVIPLLVWTDKAFKALKINIIGTKHVTSIRIASTVKEQILNVVVHGPEIAGAQANFLVHYYSEKSHWAEVYHVNLSSGLLKKAYDLPTIAGRGAFSSSTQGDKVFFIRNTDLGVTLFSSATNDVLGHWPTKPWSSGSLAGPRSISHAVSEVISRGESGFAIRSALVLSSGDWELVRNGDIVWSRPEGLAGVVAAAFGEFTTDDGLAEELAVESHSDIFRAYIHRLKRHIRGLGNFSVWAKTFPPRVRAGIFGETSSLGNQGQRHSGFGFRKIVVLATERGRVIGLDTGSQGRVLWNVEAVDLNPGERWNVCGIEIEYGTALIRGCKGGFWRVQVLDGVVLEYRPGNLTDNAKAAISILNDLGEKIWISVQSDGSLGYNSKSKLSEGTLVVTKGDQGSVQCWRPNQNADPTKIWEFHPSSGEIISKIVARPAHDPVASIGKPLGDRNVLYKYLNPNILMIVTVHAESATVKIYLLDSSSGQSLYIATHSEVDIGQPIAAVISENWIAYAIFSDATDHVQDGSTGVNPIPQGFQLVVSELFESQYPNNRGPLGSLSNFSTIYPTESENIEINSTPHVVSQAYLIPGPISHMSVTSTMQGITPRSLLCFLPSLDSIIAIPRTVLDPRRPVGRDPLPAELEEGLFRHNAVLDFEPKWVVSHKRDIMSLSNIMTAPSLLESTSLVFSFGDVDIFGTRVAPIGAFDMLGKGFSKLQLVGTVIALAVGTGVIAPMVRKKQIDGRWKA